MTAKKGVKKAAAKKGQAAAKAPAKKSATKATAKQKNGNTTKKVAAGTAKPVSKKSPQKAPVKSSSKQIKSKKARAPQAKKRAQQRAKTKQVPPVTTPVLTHGTDQHFIPLHVKNAPAPIHNLRKEEQLFHNREEVALHQENQRIKSSMATRMGRPKNLRILGKG